MDVFKDTGLILGQAWESTREGFVGSFRKAVVSSMFLAIGIFAQYRIRLFQGPPKAAWDATVSSAWDMVGTALIPAIAIFLAVFLWNVWLAPVRLLRKDVAAQKADQDTLSGKLDVFQMTLDTLVKKIDTVRPELESQMAVALKFELSALKNAVETCVTQSQQTETDLRRQRNDWQTAHMNLVSRLDKIDGE